MPTTSKEIFLTFDDGPVPGPTEFVLDTLQTFGCKATFFVIGDNVKKHPQVYQRIVKDGHTVGNHTFNHLKGWSCDNEEYIANIVKCDDVLGSKAKLFRPPYGRIKRTQINRLTAYNIIMWDVLTSDYSPTMSPEKCLKGSIAATRPGSIVVFHDSLKAERNMTYALPRYMEYFLNQGYTFKGIPPP